MTLGHHGPLNHTGTGVVKLFLLSIDSAHCDTGGSHNSETGQNGKRDR